jgi:putative ABC transport system substrate-binding protein
MMQASRRRFLTATGALFASGLVHGQSGAAQARIAILSDAKDDSTGALWRAFHARLGELGYVEGKNIAITWRFSDGVQSRLPSLAAEVVTLKPHVILTVSTPATQAVMKASSTIPIVFVGAGEPVESGLVASLARPGGNVTGTTNMSGALAAKWLEALIAIQPGASTFAFLGQTQNRGFTAVLRSMQNAANALGVSVRPFEASTTRDVEQAFERMRAERFDGFIVASSAAILSHREQIVDLAARHKLPALYARADYVTAGGLLSYGPDRHAYYRRSAEYVQRILQGARPADLPVEEPSKFELLINMRTARAIGFKMPQSLLLRADRLIE